MPPTHPESTHPHPRAESNFLSIMGLLLLAYLLSLTGCLQYSPHIETYIGDEWVRVDSGFRATTVETRRTLTLYKYDDNNKDLAFEVDYEVPPAEPFDCKMSTAAGTLKGCYYKWDDYLRFVRDGPLSSIPISQIVNAPNDPRWRSWVFEVSGNMHIWGKDGQIMGGDVDIRSAGPDGLRLHGRVTRTWYPFIINFVPI